MNALLTPAVIIEIAVMTGLVITAAIIAALDRRNR